MADNMIKFLRGNVASLPKTATAGAVYFTKDEGLYLGLEDGSYHRYGDFITVDNINALPAAGAHETCMYYCVEENVLAKWDGATWVQINKQKTLVELGGVAKSVYEAKMALLEKADTDNSTAISNLSTYVGTIPNGEDGQPIAASVVAYVNKKTEGIATSGNLQALEARVGTAESEIDALQAASTKHVEKVDGKSLIADAEIARLDAMSDGANKVEASETNGNIKIDGVETVVYTHPDKHAIGDVTGLADAIADAKKAGTDANAALEAYKTTNDKALADEATARGEADTALDGRITTLEGTITGLSGAMHFEGVKDAIPTDVTGYENGDVIIVGEKEYVFNNGAFVELGDVSAEGNRIAALETLVGNEAEGENAATGLVKAVADNVAAIATEKSRAEAKEAELAGVDATNLKTAKEYADGLNTAMNTRVEALEAIDHTHDNKGVIDGITAEKVAAWDAAEATAASALATAKSELQAEIDADVKALADGAVATNTAGIADLVAQLTWGSF